MRQTGKPFDEYLNRLCAAQRWKALQINNWDPFFTDPETLRCCHSFQKSFSVSVSQSPCSTSTIIWWHIYNKSWHCLHLSYSLTLQFQFTYIKSLTCFIALNNMWCCSTLYTPDSDAVRLEKLRHYGEIKVFYWPPSMTSGLSKCYRRITLNCVCAKHNGKSIFVSVWLIHDILQSSTFK